MNTTIVPIEKFGKDHWSTLLYLETCAVDGGGKIDGRKMRTFKYGAKQHYHTRLNDGTEVEDEQHDDWACMADMQDAGLIYPPDGEDSRWYFGDDNKVRLTDYGWLVAHSLRRWRAEGDGAFIVPLPEKPMPIYYRD